MNKFKIFLGVILMILAVGCSKKNSWSPVEGDIMTKWAKEVNPNNALPEYPRPQMVREEWRNLNGLWDYAIRPKDGEKPQSFDGKILVPFPIESALSGVKKTLGAENKLWYQTTFDIPENWDGQSILLHFGAVDWETNVWINGKEIGSHKGGYDAFKFDITDALNQTGAQELVVSVWDPTNKSFQPRGKQVDKPGGIWYTAVTGIWQTVWMEPVAENPIESFKVIPDIDKGQVTINVACKDEAQHPLSIKVIDAGKEIGTANGTSGKDIVIEISNPKLWSPESPFLYDLEISLLNENNETVDNVTGYFGMRKIALAKDGQGVTRIFLNNEFVFQQGPLDQGWWPDGLYTAPTDEALRYDIEITKALGFNMARKHVKIEPDRWYYWCDKLGLLVWQDTPSGDKYISPNEPDIQRSDESAEQFKFEIWRMVEGHYNHPSIVMWVPFNEGWGQFETAHITDKVKEFDPTRLVNSVSGWADRGVGDVHDIHSYPGPAKPDNEANRAVVLGEYGGLGLPLQGHLWRQEKNWGYRGYKTQEELLAAYQELGKKLRPLIDDGLSAAVYTQTTDVEIEVNGLMTYDRAIIKMDTTKVKLINKGYVAPNIRTEDDIFLKEGRVKLEGYLGAKVRYTLDGTEPTINSPLYTRPIIFTETTQVKAKAFWDEGFESLSSEFTSKKVELNDPVKVANPQKGLLVNYYEGAWEKMPDFSTLTPDSSGIAEKIDLSISPRSEDFALRFEGFIDVPADGIYSFFPASDDGSIVYLDNMKTAVNDGIHGVQEIAGKAALKAGLHKIVIEYFQHLGGLGFKVMYDGPGIAKQQIPGSVLFHE